MRLTKHLPEDISLWPAFLTPQEPNDFEDRLYRRLLIFLCVCIAAELARLLWA